MSDRDQATRDRLLKHAAALFAERGFKRVTVREISAAASANVAAVNYHFRDKAGLYREVIEGALAVMSATNEAAMASGRGAPAADRLRAYVRVFVERLLASNPDTGIQQIMIHELTDPTPMLDVIAERVMRPRLDFLCGVVAELTGRDKSDRRVMHCAFSIQAQCLMCKTLPSLRKMGIGVPYEPADAGALAEHIAAFSLAGIAPINAKA